MFFGFTEPLFVPGYWSPPSLFDLATRTGFDLESLVFSFAIGGIGVVLYRLIYWAELVPVRLREKQLQKHKLHRWILLLPVAVFALLGTFTSLIHIYSDAIALFKGGVATLYCRPNLAFKIGGGGLMFTSMYIVYLRTLLLLYPGYVD